jgi:hypothetical protein
MSENSIICQSAGLSVSLQLFFGVMKCQKLLSYPKLQSFDPFLGGGGCIG